MRGIHLTQAPDCGLWRHVILGLGVPEVLNNTLVFLYVHPCHLCRRFLSSCARWRGSWGREGGGSVCVETLGGTAVERDIYRGQQMYICRSPPITQVCATPHDGDRTAKTQQGPKSKSKEIKGDLSTLAGVAVTVSVPDTDSDSVSPRHDVTTQTPGALLSFSVFDSLKYPRSEYTSSE